MAEVITSPIQSSIRSIRSRFANSLFRPTISPDKNAPVDPGLTRIIIRNTNAVNSVTVQLTSVAGQVSVLTQSLQAIAQSLSLSSQLDEQRMNAEANRQRRLATIALREGKEGQIEKKLQNALLSPIEALAKRASSILGALGQYFGTILFGWLGSQSVDFLGALASGNEEKIRKIKNKIITGLAIAGGAFVAINVAITALAMSLRGLAGTLLKFTLRQLIKKPFVSLANLFRGPAGSALLKGGIIGDAPKTAAINSGRLLTGTTSSPMSKLGNFFNRLKGNSGKLLTGADIVNDVSGGKNPIGATIDSGGGLIGSQIVGTALKKKSPLLRIPAQLAAFFTGKSIVQGTREGVIGSSQETSETKKEKIIQESGGRDNIMPSMMSDTTDTKPQGIMRGLAGTADFLTFGLTDLDKQGDLIKGNPQKKNLNKQTNLNLEEAPPQVISVGGGSDGNQTSANTSSGTGRMGGSVPRIPASNNDNNYIYSGYREYQIAPK
tara:strand:- start:2523 stop:4004 length:1482 start_codon:yes stop_codon:yes gene_type:complete